MQAASQEFPTYIFLILVPVFLAIWCLNCWFLSWQSGWKYLSKRFGVRSEFLAEVTRVGRYPFELCFRCWLDYTNIAWIAPEEDALYLSVVFPFRIGHPPLRIPWSEISIGTTKVIWRKYLVFTLGSTEKIPMRISERMTRKLGILNRISVLNSGA